MPSRNNGGWNEDETGYGLSVDNKDCRAHALLENGLSAERHGCVYALHCNHRHGGLALAPELRHVSH